MTEIIALLIPAVLGLLALRLLLLPMKLIYKALIHSVTGFLCLWVLNLVSGTTGIYFPINAFTVGVAGVLGLPGIGLLALLEVM